MTRVHKILSHKEALRQKRSMDVKNYRKLLRIERLTRCIGYVIAVQMITIAVVYLVYMKEFEKFLLVDCYLNKIFTHAYTQNEKVRVFFVFVCTTISVTMGYLWKFTNDMLIEGTPDWMNRKRKEKRAKMKKKEENPTNKTLSTEKIHESKIKKNTKETKSHEKSWRQSCEKKRNKKKGRF